MAASAQQRCNHPRRDDAWAWVLKVDCKSMFTNASCKEVDKQVKCTEIQALKLSVFIRSALFLLRRILVVMPQIPSAGFLQHVSGRKEWGEVRVGIDSETGCRKGRSGCPIALPSLPDRLCRARRRPLGAGLCLGVVRSECYRIMPKTKGATAEWRP